MCLASNALWLASADAFSFQPLDHVTDQSLTFAKRSSPLEISPWYRGNQHEMRAAPNRSSSRFCVSSIAQPPRDDSTDRLSRYSASSVISEITAFALAGASNSSDRLLLVWASYIMRLLSVLPGNLALCLQMLLYLPRELPPTSSSLRSSDPCPVERVALGAAEPNGIWGSRACPATLLQVVLVFGPTTVSVPNSLGGLSVITERESARVLASVLDC